MNYVVTIFQLVPAIIAAMKAIEDAIPGKDKGEMKLAALREMLESIDDSYKDMWPKIAKVVAVLVNLFNKDGIFKK